MRLLEAVLPRDHDLYFIWAATASRPLKLGQDHQSKMKEEGVQYAMQVTTIRRMIPFGNLGNITMTAQLTDGEDPLLALADLEKLMVKGMRTFEEVTKQCCRDCGRVLYVRKNIPIIMSDKALNEMPVWGFA